MDRVSADQRGAGWWLPIFLMVLYAFSFIDRAIIGLLVEPIKADLDLTDTEFSLLAGPAFIIFYVIAGVPLGWVADRWNRRNLIAIGVALWSAATAAGGLASSAWQLFLSRVGVGVGEATLSPATYSILSDVMPPRKLAIALSVFALGTPIGTGLAALIGGPLIHALTESMWGQQGGFRPWQLVLIIVGLPGVVLALLTLLIVPEPARAPYREAARRGEKTDGKALLNYLFRNWRVYLPLFFGMGMMNLATSGGVAWYPAFLQRVHGLDIRDVGVLLGTSTLVLGIAGSLFAGWLAGRFFIAGKLDAHFRVGLIYSALLLPCAVLGPTVPDETASMVLIALAAFFTMTWVGVNAAALQLVTPARMRGRLSGIYQAVGSLIGAGIGPTVVALVTDVGFGDDRAVGWSLGIVSAIALTGGCLILNSGRRHLADLVAERTGTAPVMA